MGLKQFAFLFVSLLSCFPAFAQDVAIAGRTEATSGQLVVLSATTPNESYQWVFDGQQFGDVMTCGESKTLAFVPPKPGRYVVWIVAQSGDQLVKKVHAISVSDVAQSGESPSDGSDQTPITGLDEAIRFLADGYAKKAVALADAPTSALIAAELKAASESIRGSATLEDAGARVGQAFERAMSSRTGLSRYVDWLGGFRQPLNEDIQALVDNKMVSTPAHLDMVIQAIAEAIGKG